MDSEPAVVAVVLDGEETLLLMAAVYSSGEFLLALDERTFSFLPLVLGLSRMLLVVGPGAYDAIGGNVGRLCSMLGFIVAPDSSLSFSTSSGLSLLFGSTEVSS